MQRLFLNLFDVILLLSWRRFECLKSFLFAKRSIFQVKHHFTCWVHEITKAMGYFEVTVDENKPRA